jgi:hypothetical protein
MLSRQATGGIVGVCTAAVQAHFGAWNRRGIVRRLRDTIMGQPPGSRVEALNGSTMSHMSQAPLLIESMRQPQAYPHAATDVSMLETHISWVMLAGDNQSGWSSWITRHSSYAGISARKSCG